MESLRTRTTLWGCCTRRTSMRPVPSGSSSRCSIGTTTNASTDAGPRFKKAVDHHSNVVDVRDHLGFPDWVVRVVVREVAFALQTRERLPEFPHLFGKPGRHILAARLGLPVLQRTVHPPPHRSVVDRASASGQTVRAGARQTMELGVVRGADGAAQVRPARPAGVDLRKVGGYLQQVIRLHDATSRPNRPPIRR